MAFSKVEDSCYPKTQVSTFKVSRTPYHGLVITARDGRRYTHLCLTWGALALCSVAAIAVSSVSVKVHVHAITGDAGVYRARSTSAPG